jgi:hypothetical protein
MRRAVVSVALFALFSTGIACRDITDDDLVGRFMFQRDSVRLDLRLNADHTFVETIVEAGVGRTESGTWSYLYGTRDLSLNDVWVPVVTPGSKRGQLKKTFFSFNVEPCGIRTLCLVVSDNDQLEFRKE